MKNIDVAKAHRNYQKLVGYLISKAAFLAIILNTIVVPCGLVTVALSFTQGLFALGIIAVIGVLLAIVADGMTLSACARVRRGIVDTRKIEQDFACVENPTNTLLKIKDDRVARSKKMQTNNILFIAFFGVVSASAGDVFWHGLLSALPDWLAWTFSTIFAVLVTGTLIACEIYRTENSAIVGESIEGSHYLAQALREDANEEAVKILSSRYAKEIKELAETTDTISIAIEESSQEAYDNLLSNGTGRIPLRIKQERQAREHASAEEARTTHGQLKLVGGQELVSNDTGYERVRAFMERNPRAKNVDICASHPDIPSSTVKVYASRVRSENAS
jgi:hypothetical protein